MLEKNKKRTPDVRKIKKHSDIVRTYKSSKLSVGGQREKTPTGYKVSGFSGNDFETAYEVMLEGTSTDVLKGDGTKVLRLISGLLFIVVYKEDGANESRKIIPGDEVAVLKDMPYRLATSTEQAEFFVCQTPGYDDSLETVEEAAVSRPVPPELLSEPTMQQRLTESRPQETIPRRKGSKAKEQNVALMSGKKSEQVVPPSEKAVPESAAREGGLNPRPTGGHFAEEGAG